MEKIRAGIMGGAGYTGGELLRLLLLHPNCDVRFVHSRSHAGQKISDIHADLYGETDLTFTAGRDDEIDVLFLCMGHGESARYLKENPLPAGIRLVDFSQDFRIAGAGSRDFVYGLPELNRDSISGAHRVANPGCFATALQLGLLPLAKAQQINSDVHISAVTGSTGAGQGLSATSHFSWRNNNFSLYKPFRHQHLAEIQQSLRQLQPEMRGGIYFLPHRGNFTRGILASMYLQSDLSQDAAVGLFENFYRGHPFVRVIPENPDLKQVVNTNNCFLHLEKIDGTLLIVSIIDNLLKGASGQAVQNMNLMFGLEETCGLKLKPAAF